VGDFVLAHGDLAEVIAVAESFFGYVSYEVLYLVGSPMPDISQDWFPAQNTRVLFSRRELRKLISEMVARGEVPPEMGEHPESAAGNENFRDAVKDLWDRVLRQHVLGR
jgi:hypothetical protein